MWYYVRCAYKCGKLWLLRFKYNIIAYFAGFNLQVCFRAEASLQHIQLYKFWGLNQFLIEFSYKFLKECNSSSIVLLKLMNFLCPWHFNQILFCSIWSIICTIFSVPWHLDYLLWWSNLMNCTSDCHRFVFINLGWNFSQFRRNLGLRCGNFALNS